MIKNYKSYKNLDYKNSTIGTIDKNIRPIDQVNIMQKSLYNYSNKTEKNKDYYNKYDDYLNKSGLTVENKKAIINKNYLNIDTSLMNKFPKIITDGNKIIIKNNSLRFMTIKDKYNTQSYYLEILNINNKDKIFLPKDKIFLKNLKNNKIIFNNNNYIKFVDNSSFVIFKFVDDKDNYIYDPGFILSENNPKSYKDLKFYNTDNMTVKISGFLPEINNYNKIGNIPVNILNSTHQIYFLLPENSNIKEYNTRDENNIMEMLKYFYIDIKRNYFGEENIILNLPITLEFNFYGGINVNSINAFLPISVDNLLPYHEIHSTTDTSIIIKLNKEPIYGFTEIYNNITYSKIFGNEIIISKIKSIENNFISESEFRVEIPKNYKNVIGAKLINTIIPNTTQTIYKNFNSCNNRLYWQNRDDNDYIYSIEVEPGVYTPQSLAEKIKNKVYEVPRINFQNDINNISKNYIDITIDSDTNIVTLSSYNETILSKPIYKILPTITENQNEDVKDYEIFITHPNHCLSVGSTIMIKGMISTHRISSNYLNNTFKVKSVISQNEYSIMLLNINLSPGSLIITYGGYSCYVYIENYFRLLFNTNDTMGKVLGFRNVGLKSSITKFSSTLTNKDPYNNEFINKDQNGIEYLLDYSGNKKILKNEVLRFSGNDYILLVIKEFSDIINKEKDSNEGYEKPNFFSKINLIGIPGTINYDTFVDIYKKLNSIKISELNIKFLNPDGTNFDFCGLDVSFILELTTITYEPEGGEINTIENPY